MLDRPDAVQVVRLAAVQHVSNHGFAVFVYDFCHHGDQVRRPFVRFAGRVRYRHADAAGRPMSDWAGDTASQLTTEYRRKYPTRQLHSQRGSSPVVVYLRDRLAWPIYPLDRWPSSKLTCAAWALPTGVLDSGGNRAFLLHPHL